MRLIVYDRGEYPEYHRWLESLFQRRTDRPVLAEEHDSVTSLIASVEGGRGIALVPESLACLAGSRLCLRRVVGGVRPFVVGVARRRGIPEPLTAGFIEASAEEPGVGQ